MDAYLAKPLEPQELWSVLASVVPGAPAPPVPVAGPAPAPSVAVIDQARVLERVGGDRRALAGLARLFLADVPKRLAAIREAVEARDPAALRSAAHALKGAVSNFAARAATDAALRLQRMGETGDLTAARSACGILEDELLRVEQALRAFALSRGTSRGRPRSAPR
jgi:HPt (histidine-containing phosphotransfer) domain-containing protein